MDEEVALVARMRESAAAWRASQPPAALLEADVRSGVAGAFRGARPPPHRADEVARVL